MTGVCGDSGEGVRASEAKSGQPTREKLEHCLKSAYSWNPPPRESMPAMARERQGGHRAADTPQCRWLRIELGLICFSPAFRKEGEKEMS